MTKGGGTAYDDLPLLALEKQFNEMIAKLLTLTQAYKEPARQPVPPCPNRSIDGAVAKHAMADQTKDVEAILATHLTPSNWPSCKHARRRLRDWL
jgi:hypothetical protein